LVEKKLELTTPMNHTKPIYTLQEEEEEETNPSRVFEFMGRGITVGKVSQNQNPKN
jgi:hypothetical protein